MQATWLDLDSTYADDALAPALLMDEAMKTAGILSALMLATSGTAYAEAAPLEIHVELAHGDDDAPLAFAFQAAPGECADDTIAGIHLSVCYVGDVEGNPLLAISWSEREGLTVREHSVNLAVRRDERATFYEAEPGVEPDPDRPMLAITVH